MTNKKIVLFDLDGTLIDTAPDMHLALSILLSEEKMETVPYDKVRPQVSNGVLGIFSVAFSDDRVTEGDRYERYLDIYESVLGQECKLFSNANNLLDIQEFMIKPVNFERFSDALRAGAEIFHNLKKIVVLNSLYPIFLCLHILQVV